MNARAIPLKTPPLQNGDRLNRAEFERRYHAMPQVKKAELIEGEVFIASPVSFEYHGQPDDDIAWFLKHYTVFTEGTESGGNATARLDAINEPQPDHTLIVRPDVGGRVKIDQDGYITGSPKLVVEVSGSSASIDTGRKLTAYQRNQVAEYIIWRVYDAELDWFIFRDGRFVLHPPDPADGLLKSVTFPGLWLDAAALVRRDLAVVLAALSRGLASPEHTAFVARLQAVASAAPPG